MPRRFGAGQADVIARVEVLAGRSPLRLAFAPGELTISAQTQEVGEGRESLPCDFRGEPLEIGFNPAFLREGVESIPGDTVVLKLITPLRRRAACATLRRASGNHSSAASARGPGLSMAAGPEFHGYEADGRVADAGEGTADIGDRNVAGAVRAGSGARAPAFTVGAVSSRHPAAAASAICERMFVTSQGSPLTRLRRALVGGDLLAARAAASELPHVDLDDAAALLLLIAGSDPARLDAAAVRFLGRACLERSFITLDDAQLLVACLTQLERGDQEARTTFARALQRLKLERAARRLDT